MASVKFYLKDAKAEKSNIYFFLNYGAFEIVNDKKKYLPLKYYINESIKPEFWNKDKGRAKQDKRFKQFPEFNARLQDVEDKALSVLRNLQNDNILINSEILRERLDIVLKPDKDQSNRKEIQLLNFFDFYLGTSGISASTQKAYRQTKRDLEQYEQERNVKLTFERIDIDFHDDFIIFLKGKNYSPNTIGDRIKVVKVIMRSSLERGLHNNTHFQKKAFNKPTEQTTAVYLNEKELQTLYKLDLSDSKKLNNVRDWFLIAAYTGLRFSDFSRLTEDNIKNDVISIKTQKTGVNVVVPIHTIVKSILEKHNYTLPKVMSNQKFNEYIKDVCKEAEILDPILVEETKGNTKVRRSYEKYKLVSAHTARRSFATNAFLAGVPTIQIMKLTGHKTEKVFMKYIKISESENAKKLQLHPFFNRMIVK